MWLGIKLISAVLRAQLTAYYCFGDSSGHDCNPNPPYDFWKSFHDSDASFIISSHSLGVRIRSISPTQYL